MMDCLFHLRVPLPRFKGARISVTLEGPDSIQLADYSDNITTAHIFPSSEEPKA